MLRQIVDGNPRHNATACCHIVMSAISLQFRVRFLLTLRCGTIFGPLLVVNWIGNERDTGNWHVKIDRLVRANKQTWQPPPPENVVERCTHTSADAQKSTKWKISPPKMPEDGRRWCTTMRLWRLSKRKPTNVSGTLPKWCNTVAD